MWRQPELELGPFEPFESSGSFGRSGFGAAASVTVARPVGSIPGLDVPAAFVAEAGYKMRGYLAGERLSAGPIVRVGFGLDLR